MRNAEKKNLECGNRKKAKPTEPGNKLIEKSVFLTLWALPHALCLFFIIPNSAFRLPHSYFCPLSSDLCLLSSDLCLLSSDLCLLSSDLCLLSSGLRPPAAGSSHPRYSLPHPAYRTAMPWRTYSPAQPDGQHNRLFFH